MRLVYYINAPLSIYDYIHTVKIVCVSITNTMISRLYSLSSITVVSLSVFCDKHPPNCTTHTAVDDTFHTEREWSYLFDTDSGKVSYKMECSVLYDYIIMM